MDTKDRTFAGHKRTAAGDIKSTYATMGATQTAWTEYFAAPELKAEKKATQHTDMFAYGKTVNWVHSKGRCEPRVTEADPHRTRGQIAVLVTALTSEKPTSRPSASDFTILNDVNRQVARECVLGVGGPDPS